MGAVGHTAMGVSEGVGSTEGVPLGVAPNDALGEGDGRVAHGQNRIQEAPPVAPQVDDGPTGFQQMLTCDPAVSVEVVYPGSAAAPAVMVSVLVSDPHDTPASFAIASSSSSLGCRSNAAATQPPCAAQVVSHDAPGALATQSPASVMNQGVGEGLAVVAAV